MSTALALTLVSVLTPFLMMPFMTLVWLSMALCATWSLAHVWLHRWRGWRAGAPLLICLLAVVLATSIPWNRVWTYCNFHLLAGRRNDVLAQVHQGGLRPNVEHNASLIDLGFEWPGVSMGGNQIVVEEHKGRTYVFFFTYRGILRSYSGFLHVPEGGDPRLFSDLFEQDSTLIIPYAEEWYLAHHW